MSKKIKVLYVYGYGSNPDDSSTYMNIKKYLPNDKYSVYCEYYAQYDPVEALKDINVYINKHKIDLVVGSSLGGFLTLHLKGIKKLVINPTLHPENDLPNLTKDVQRADADGKPMVDENNNPIIDTIPAVPEHIVNFYKDYVKDNKIFDGVDDNEVNLTTAIFGTHDELFSYKDEYLTKYVNSFDYDMGHHSTEDDVTGIIVPTIKILSKFYNL